MDNHIGGSMATTSSQFNDACELLEADHRSVKKLFKEYESLIQSNTAAAIQRKHEIALAICTQLTVHMLIEEEIFYPAFRASITDLASIHEAEVEHQTAKYLISQIERMSDSQEKQDARVVVLSEYIDHHVQEERNEIFSKARASKQIDLLAVRDALQARKDALLSEIAAN
jgi:hemerythrin-like domain-containing protein